MKWLVINCTNACNFSCKTCIREYGRSSNVSLDLLRNIIPDAKKLGYSGVSLTGGEPCLHPHFEELVELFVNEGFIFGFVSNGSMPEKYTFILEKYRDALCFAAFSVDGATANIHDAIRQDGSYQKVVATISQFVQAGVAVKITSCINKLNRHQLEALVLLALQRNVKTINFLAAIATDENRDLILTEQEKREAIETIEALRLKYKIELNICSSLRAMEGVDFCTALNELSDFTINPKGEVVFCCDTVRDGAVIGSLVDESFTELYCKALDTVARLKKIRAKALVNGTPSHNFNTCEFCNQSLQGEIIKL